MRFDRDKFWHGFRPFYRAIGGHLTDEQVRHVEFLLKQFEGSEQWDFLPHIAYALATLHIETYVPRTNHRYGPITEFGSKSYFNRYEGRLDLGNTEPGDGYRFRGRGFQITGRKNYTRIGKAIGRDLVNDPELVNDPYVAFDAMTVGIFRGYYTGKKITDYINAKKVDYKNARRIYNGLDRAAEIASIAEGFEDILRSALISAAGSTSTEPISDTSVTAITATDASPTPADPSQPDVPVTGPPPTITQYIPKITTVRNWFATISLGGIASTTWAAFNGLPPWAVFVLGFVTAVVIVGLVVIVVRYKSQIFDLVKWVAANNADPTTNNIELVDKK